MGQKVFKTSMLGGFKKKDVIKYLEDINQMVKSRNDEHSADIAQLKAEIMKRDADIARFDESYINIQHSIADKNEKLELAASRMNQLGEEKRRLTERVSDMQRYIQELEIVAAQAREQQEASHQIDSEKLEMQKTLSQMLSKLGQMADELSNIVENGRYYAAAKAQEPAHKQSEPPKKGKREKSSPLEEILNRVLSTRK